MRRDERIRRIAGFGLVVWLLAAGTTPLWHGDHDARVERDPVHSHVGNTFLCESTSHIVEPVQPCVVCSSYRLLSKAIGEQIRPCEAPHRDGTPLTILTFEAVAHGRSSSEARAPPLC